MKRSLLLALVLLALGASEAQALSSQRTGGIVRQTLREGLASSLSYGKNPAPTRVYGCKPRECQFWVHGTAECAGEARVREDRDYYWIWFTKLECS